MKKTNNYSLGYDYPEANITVNRNRVRQYGEIVYLPNESEFEIELYNPKSTSVLAKIKINGQYISDIGIVVKPAQRIYLERYLDTAQKYKFSVYTIDGNCQKNLDAIAANGDIAVEFYDEVVPISRTYYWDNMYYYQTTIGHSKNQPYQLTTNNCHDGYYSSVDFVNDRLTPKGQQLYDSIETGRVERGGESNQKFVESYNNFSYMMSHSIKIKILPESQKPIESGDLRVYCDCGYRIRKSSWKFCPSCGNNLE